MSGAIAARREATSASVASGRASRSGSICVAGSVFAASSSRSGREAVATRSTDWQSASANANSSSSRLRAAAPPPNATGSVFAPDCSASRIAWNLARLPRRRSATEDFITNERRSSKAARCSGESPSSPAPRSMAAASSSASFGSRHAARREVAPPSFAAESFAPSRRSSTGAFFFAAGGTLTAGSFASWERADAQNFFHSVPFGSANVSSVVWSFATVMSP